MGRGAEVQRCADPPSRSVGSNESAPRCDRPGRGRRAPRPSRPSWTTELRCALVAAPGGPRRVRGPRAAPAALEDARPPRRPPGCRPSAPRRPWCVRPSAAARSSGASSLAAVAYQNSPSAVVPSALAASHRSAATRQAPAPLGAAGERRPGAGRRGRCSRWGRCTTPARGAAPAPSVSRSRSLFTLAATTGPRHPRMAGTARLVVLPLWVGPTTTSDCAGSAAMAAGRTVTRDHAEEQTAPGGGAPA